MCYKTVEGNFKWNRVNKTIACDIVFMLWSIWPGWLDSFSYTIVSFSVYSINLVVVALFRRMFHFYTPWIRQKIEGKNDVVAKNMRRI